MIHIKPDALLVWAVIAAHAFGDEDRAARYRDELQAVASDTRSVGNREPLFFCPVTKGVADFDKTAQ